jgi:hypothetical protein
MTISKNLAVATEKLKSILGREFEYLVNVFQCLVLISFIDELCYVKLTNKRDLLRSILTRKQK